MKKVLFIIGTLQSGGVSKSIVNLLNIWDKNTYKTSLFILSKRGDVFSSYLPKDLNIIWNEDIDDLHAGIEGLKRLLIRRKFLLAFGSLIRMLLSLKYKYMAGRLLAWLMPTVSKEKYDLIVDYGGQQLLYYMVDKLKGNKKVTFFHNDYSKWSYYYKADRKYFPKVDSIFSISNTCVDALKKYFPECTKKIRVMENISSPIIIQKQSMENIDIPKADILLATLGHFCKRKGGDLAIEVGKILKLKGINFKWFFVGNILDKDLYKQVKLCDLEEYFIFTGIKLNPYPYIKACDIYVHPSRFEGKSIALDEAKILCKPIVVTNFSTVKDQFKDRVNASICNMNAEDITAKILELSFDISLKEKYTKYLSEHMINNSDEIKKLYKFL
jgi:hypothetical protein